MKGKPLLPTLRTKKRYVVYETISDKDIKNKDVYNTIKSSYKECFGKFGLGDAGLMNTKIYKKNKGILKINHKYVDKLKTAMAMITEVNKKKAIIKTITVSGILKKAKLKLKE
jgi:ribonuclease P/MRP protein subunit POP5